jgi:hypothetical protein
MRRYSVSGVAWGSNDGYAQVLPVWVTNYLRHQHQHASPEGSEGATHLPHATANFTSLPPALVSRLYDERSTLAKRGCEGIDAYLPFTNAPGKRDGPIKQRQEVKRCPVGVGRQVKCEGAVFLELRGA